MKRGKDLHKHPSVKAYVQHGFIPQDETQTQIFGMCPFCGKDKKFYVNKSSKAWDCKVCGREGGFNIFLSKMSKLCIDHFKGSVAIKLSKNRKLRISILKHFNVGYNPITSKYTIPARDAEGKIKDLRIYDWRNVISTHTCKAPLIGRIERLYDPSIVYLCEGEWDYFAMYEIMQKITLDDRYVILAVPGARTFKSDWLQYMQNRRVFVLYDNDESGQKGAVKVFNILRGYVRELKFLRWKTEYSNKFDLRDLYVKNKCKAKTTFEQINEMLHDYPKNVDEEEVAQEEKETKIVYDGIGLPAQEVYDAYKKWLHLPDTDVIDYLYGTIIANRLDGDPIWSFIVAPSGFTKSEFLMSVGDAKGIHTEDNLTSAGLVSGWNEKGVDMSLLPLLAGMVLDVKDITTILTERSDQKDRIFGMLRTIYDGKYKHRFGNVHRVYEVRFGIIAGVTPALEIFLAEEKALGERFIKFELKLPESQEAEKEYIKRAVNNTTHETKIRKELQKVANKCLNYDFKDNVTIPEKIENKIVCLAMYTSILRGKVEYNKYTREIMFNAFREVGTRVAKQFIKLLKGICMFRRIDQATFREYRIIKRLARGTVFQKYDELVYACYRNSKKGIYTPESISMLKGIKLSATVCKMTADALYMLDVFERTHSKMNLEYTFKADFLKLIEGSGVYDNIKKHK